MNLNKEPFLANNYVVLVKLIMQLAFTNKYWKNMGNKILLFYNQQML